MNVDNRLRELAEELASDLALMDNGYFSEYEKNKDAVIATAREVAKVFELEIYDGPES